MLIIPKTCDIKITQPNIFTDSTLAYQHYGMNVDKKIIFTLNNFLLKNIKVNFTFLHLVNEKNLKSRLLKRKKLNRYDKFNLNFYKKVQKGYTKLVKLNRKNLRTE